MEIDVSVFLNYGIAGLILLVFYMLWREELKSLREAIIELKMTQEKLTTLLDIIIKKLLGDKK